MAGGPSERKLRKTLLLLILAAAIFLRFQGIFSSKTNPSEGNLIGNSAHLFKTGSLKLRDFSYPSLYFYLSYGLQELVHQLAELSGAAPEDPHESSYGAALGFYSGRFLSALFSFLTLLLLYRMALILSDWPSAFASVVFLSFFFLTVVGAHEAKPDSLQVFMAVASCYMALRYLKDGKLSTLLAAAFVAGLSTASKYMFISAFPITLAILERKDSWKGRLVKWGLVGLFSFAGFFAGCPYCILNFRRVLKTFTAAKYYFTGYIQPVSHPLLLALRDTIVYTGYLPGLLFLLSLLLLRKKEHRVVLSLPILYYIIIAFSRLYAARYLVVVMPFVALYAGYMLGKLIRRPVPVLLLSFLISLPQAAQSYSATRWLASGLNNHQILSAFIKNSLLPHHLPLAFHAYRIPSRKYYFMQQLKEIRVREFVVYGKYEQDNLVETSPGYPHVKKLTMRIKRRYCPLLLLEKTRLMEFVFDYNAGLYHRKPFRSLPCRPPQLLFPLVTKAYNPEARFLFLDNLYSRDLVVRNLRRESRFRVRIVGGQGQVLCYAVVPYGGCSYRLRFSGERLRSKPGRPQVICLSLKEENPSFDFLLERGRADVLVFSLPINAALFAFHLCPERAKPLLRWLAGVDPYRFEARRLLSLLEGRRDRALIRFAARLRRRLDEAGKLAFAKGVDASAVEKTQRIYLKFWKKEKGLESEPFYILPGVYTARGFEGGALVLSGRELPFRQGSVRVEKPGWAKIVLSSDKVEPMPFIYFDFKKTLEWELFRLLR